MIHDAFAAAAEKAPGIAAPIIDKAVSDKKITQAQADRITKLVKHGGPAAGFGHGPGPGGPHFGPPLIADKDMRAVLEDVHSAVAKQAPDIAGPVIDKAEQDGKITSAQADKLRDAVGAERRQAAGRQAARRPAAMLPLRDADVREVLHDAFEAIAAKRAEIAKPIIDKAVADKKITETQADQLRKLLSGDKGGFPGPGPALGKRARRTSSGTSARAPSVPKVRLPPGSSRVGQTSARARSLLQRAGLAADSG